MHTCNDGVVSIEPHCRWELDNGNDNGQWGTSPHARPRHPGFLTSDRLQSDDVLDLHDAARRSRQRGPSI